MARSGAQQTPAQGDEQVLAEVHGDAQALLENVATSSESSASPHEARLSRGQEFEIILNELSGSAPFSDADRLITVDELERRYIERVLTLTSGNKSRAAQILGFDRRTLYRKIERYGRSQ